LNQTSDGAPGQPAPDDPGHRDNRENGELLAMLARKLESRGLEYRLVTYSAGGPADERTVEIVVTNPADPQRGEVRIGDDGGITWEYFGEMSEAGAGRILDEATNALRATGMRFRPGPQAAGAPIPAFPVSSAGSDR
jgi:hypothetical protein